MNKEGSVTNSLNKISSGITRLCDRIEAIPGRKPERIVLVVYLLSRILMILVHEPWFDESLAWLIARDSSLSEILFTAPHYEGHPSLWHLVLMPFAKAGAPFELSLGLVSLIFSGLAMWLFIYKAPFKRIVRLLMPFTYFMFYQFGVVSRPYCMVMLAIVLMALTYGMKDVHPGRFVLSLWFLCITCAYGLVIAGGVCIVWLIEMLLKAYEASKNKNSGNGEYRGAVRIFIEDHLVRGGKIVWLLGLLAYAVFIIYRIMPAEDAFAVLNVEDSASTSFVVRLLYMLFGILSDLFITNTYSYGTTITVSGLGIIDVLPSVLIGAGILAVLIYVAKKRGMLLLFVVPYSMLILIMTWLYMSRHHMGIVLLYLLFFMWIYTEKSEHEKIEKTTKDGKSEKRDLKTSLIVLFAAVGMIIPLYWNISSSIVDVVFNYSLGRDEYAFLKENGYLDNTILAEWEKMPVAEEGSNPITFSVAITGILPYMDKDTFLNSPAKAGYNYSLIHKPPTSDMTDKLIDSINNVAPPDIIIGSPEYTSIYSVGFSFIDYECTCEVEGGLIWKGVPEMRSEKIYVRKNK